MAKITALNPSHTYAQYHGAQFLYPDKTEEESPEMEDRGTPLSEPVFNLKSVEFYRDAKADLKQTWQQHFLKNAGMLDPASPRYIHYHYLLLSARLRGQWVTYLCVIKNYVKTDSIVQIGGKFYRSPTLYQKAAFASSTTESDQEVMKQLKELLESEAKLDALHTQK